MTTSLITPATFETGKVYTFDRVTHTEHLRVVKITSHNRYSTRSRTLVEHKWVTFESGHVRDGEFHPHDSKKIRRKVYRTNAMDQWTEFVWETASHLTRIKATDVEQNDA